MELKGLWEHHVNLACHAHIFCVSTYNKTFIIVQARCVIRCNIYITYYNVILILLKTIKITLTQCDTLTQFTLQDKKCFMKRIKYYI